MKEESNILPKGFARWKQLLQDTPPMADLHAFPKIFVVDERGVCLIWASEFGAVKAQGQVYKASKRNYRMFKLTELIMGERLHEGDLWRDLE